MEWKYAIKKAVVKTAFLGIENNPVICSPI